MRVLVCYDVSTVSPEGARRLRRIAEACQDFGTRVQLSVFECPITEAGWVELKARLLAVMKPEENSLRFYFLDERTEVRTEHHGVRRPVELRGPLVV